MYESPINIAYGKMDVQLEGAILKAVQEIGVTVDKEELLTALEYDRNQYCKGYRDAVQERGLVEVVRCKDCKHWTYDNYHKHNYCSNKFGLRYVCPENNFCSYGERREGE